MRDPFIFSKGIQGLSPVKEELDNIKKTQPDEPVPSVVQAGVEDASEVAGLGVDTQDKEKQSRIQDRFGSAVSSKFFQPTLRDSIIEANETQQSREHGGL
jgi:hypothetical protein